MHEDIENWQLENSYTDLPEAFYSLQAPVPVAAPRTICFNSQLAANLGLDFLKQSKEQTAAYLSGNKIPPNTKPLAQAYAGHQFGHFTMLGDGRAILLAKQQTPTGEKYDLQLKGAGKTPYSRRGDGRATLYSMLREYIMSEAMHHLGIATSRSLAVVATGEPVFREKTHEGAVLSRVAKSHLRVGTFEYARNLRPIEELQALADYTIAKHYPELQQEANPVLALFKALLQKQIDLVVDWMRVGFIHGVMNTDNMSITAETIDYGPCAFMNAYSLDTVFSSIDHQGRYAFGNQAYMVKWNLTAFANAILPLIDEDSDKAVALAQAVLDEFQPIFTEKWHQMMFAKLGIVHPSENDKELISTLLQLMENHKADYTQTFLALEENRQLDNALFIDNAFLAWKTEWLNAQNREDDKIAALALMKKTNPRIIPRNHWVEDALNAAVEGNMIPFNDLLELLIKPYTPHSEHVVFQSVSEDFDKNYQTFCGT